MIEIPLLDLHITHTCNLTCESCSDFTNHKLLEKFGPAIEE
jgi:hypothetical protein